MKWNFAALPAFWPAVPVAQDWYGPQRGSAGRRDLMNAIRPKAMRLFGAPVEFVIRELRVSRNLAFAPVTARRPGGVAIGIRQTPGWQTGCFLPDANRTGGETPLGRSGAGWRRRK